MIYVNGKTYKGNSVSVINDKVYVDGVLQSDASNPPHGILRVEVAGDPVNVQSDVAVSVQGNVLGDAVAGSSINCNDVGGNVQAGSSVNCGKVSGSVMAGSSVRHG